MPSLDKHTLRRLARSTLNELHQNQHEKASLVCARVQSPSGLALVPCALSMVDLSGQLRCRITQKSLVQKNVFIFLFLAPYARTTRYEEAFFSLENQGKKCLLRSRASLLIMRPFFAFRQKSRFIAGRTSIGCQK